MSKIRSGVWRCKGGFGGPDFLAVPDGALVPVDFPYSVMDGREELFVCVEAAPQVEQATAAPGERRAVRARS
jgi:hypothetical protein